jgi:hypothetical protein
MMVLHTTSSAASALKFTHRGHKISIRTINFNQPWQSTHRNLLALIA